METLKLEVVMLVTLMVLAELAVPTTVTPKKYLLESKPLPSAASLSHCLTKCGDINITDVFDVKDTFYPFGIGPGCFRSGFQMICDESTYPPKLFLGDNTTEVSYYGYFYDEYLLVRFDIRIMQPVLNSFSGSWNPGRSFTVYADSWVKSAIVVIGCGVDAYFFDEKSKEIGNCSTTCMSYAETRRQIGFCNGIGCCNIPIDHQPYPIRFQINRDREKSNLPLGNVKIFVHSYTNETRSFIYRNYTFSQEDLESTDTVQGMDFFFVPLKWSITDQPTCEKAQEDNKTYACISKYSECISNSVPGTGYTCSCSEKAYGNPYIVDGCQVNLYNGKSLPDKICTRKCGNVAIPFPFGLTEGCYGKDHFRLDCRNAQLFIPKLTGEPRGQQQPVQPHEARTTKYIGLGTA